MYSDTQMSSLTSRRSDGLRLPTGIASNSWRAAADCPAAIFCRIDESLLTAHPETKAISVASAQIASVRGTIRIARESKWRRIDMRALAVTTGKFDAHREGW